MCRDCGCETANKRASFPGLLTLEQKVLQKNDRIAQENRGWFDRSDIRALNLMSSPGAGKTLLLEKTIEKIQGSKKLSIITGDQQQDYDAQRLLVQGAHVHQLNTLSSCHLDASMISGQLGQFVKTGMTDLLIIENVGNLVCPAAFDLGEHERVALLSTTEGEDKPGKYPLLFHTATLVVITKIDLIPYLDWSESLCESHIRQINPKVRILKVSAKTGEGLDGWIEFLKSPRAPGSY